MLLQGIKRFLKNKKVQAFQDMRVDYQRNPFRYWFVLFLVTVGVLLKTTWLDGQMNGLFFFIFSVIIIFGLRLDMAWVIGAGLVLTLINMIASLWDPSLPLIITGSDYVFLLLLDCVLLMIFPLYKHKSQS